MLHTGPDKKKKQYTRPHSCGLVISYKYHIKYLKYVHIYSLYWQGADSQVRILVLCEMAVQQLISNWVSASSTFSFTTYNILIITVLTIIFVLAVKRIQYVRRINKVPGIPGGYTILGNAVDVSKLSSTLPYVV